jgi:hypothetical protein
MRRDVGRVPTRSAQLVNGEEGAQTSGGTGRSVDIIVAIGATLILQGLQGFGGD